MPLVLKLRARPAVWSAVALLALPSLLPSCRKAPQPKPLASSAAPTKPSSAAAPTPSAPSPLEPAHRMHSSPATPETHNDDEDVFDSALNEEGERRFQREFSIARKAVSQKQYAQAIAHYTKALATGKNDAACLGERGYTRLQMHDLPGAKSDLADAAGARGDAEVHAQVWYNLGLVQTENNQPEEARLAFARSLALRPNRTVAGKLGNASKCPSSISRGPETEGAPAAVLKSWRETFDFFGASGEPKNEQEARQLVCSADGYGGSEVRDCSDEPPFTVACCGGMGRFMLRYMSVVPRSNGRIFAIHHGMRGGWPGGCQGAPLPEVSIQGKMLLVSTLGREVGSNGDYEAPPEAGGGEPSADPPCRVTPFMEDYAVYNLDTGKRVVAVSSIRPVAPKVELNADGTQLTITGQDCDETVALK